MQRVFTGNYEQCKVGNLISISGDRGEDAGFVGKCIPELAPKKDFFRRYKDNKGKIPDEVNDRYYIEQYYTRVLSQVDIEELLKGEVDPILLCYEKDQEFCHRHVVAEYIEMVYGVKVRDILVDEDLNVEENTRPPHIKQILAEVMEQYKDQAPTDAGQEER
ncbi:MAG: DUF488 family protein [Clostridia bacterium]|nr:DUF488 family protein [Clostridia bacterium]